jgi:drug/metabolite transporter (DMT)-like permease
MTQAVPYALGAMLCFGAGDIIYKRAGSAGVRPDHLLMVQSWVFLSSGALYGLATSTLVFVPGTLWGCLTGLFMWLGFYNFAHSLRSGSISVAAPIFRLSFVLTAVLAILFLGERLTVGKGAGIALALAATWLLLAAPGASAGPGSALLRVLVATTAFGTGNLVYKFGLAAGATPASLMVAQGAAVVTIGTAFVARADGRIRPRGAVLVYAPVAAVVLAFAFALMVESLALGDASLVVPIAQMGFVVTSLFGFVVMREGVTPRKLTGLAAAVAALASFASG